MFQYRQKDFLKELINDYFYMINKASNYEKT